MSTPPHISVYIHIPFCKTKCRYCDFYSVAETDPRIERYLEALGREFAMKMERYGLQDAVTVTIYCGGGTPSMLSPDLWQRLTARVIQPLRLAPDLEWTVECNPDSFTTEKADAWLSAGVTRPAIGVQSLDDRCLRFLGRPHSSRQVLELLASPILTRFRSVGVDMIYGLPGQTVEVVARTARTLTQIPVVRHLSAYELTIAPETPFGRHRSLLPLPSEDAQIEMHESIRAAALLNGFEHYEISNYASAGHRCRHNERYWTHQPYVGLGPSAHSYIPPHRSANVADLQTYFLAVEEGRLPIAYEEELGSDDLEREAIMLGLRTADGIDEEDFRRLTGRAFAGPARTDILQRLTDEGYLEHVEGAWRPTPKGILTADALARALI